MNDNLPAGALNDPRAPFNQPDPEPRYKVVTNEYWEEEESKGFEVFILEVGTSIDPDEVELWYNYDMTNDTEVEFVDEYVASSFEDAKRFFNGQKQFYTNDNE